MQAYGVPHTSLLLPLALLLAVGCTPLNSSRDSGLHSADESSAWYSPQVFSKRIRETGRRLVGKGYDPDKAREVYGIGEMHYRAGLADKNSPRRDELLQAARRFRNAADRWPDSALEQDALFLAGESYFFADHYPRANDLYEQLIAKYPHTKYLDVVAVRRFALADYWLKLNEVRPQPFWAVNVTNRQRPWRDTFGHAVRIFDRIRIDDPTGRLADDATLAAGNACFTRGRFLDADSFYTDLRNSFPSSDHQFNAHLLGVKAKMMSYEGPDYAGQGLEEAEKLIRQMRRLFPNDAEQHRDYLNRAYAEVRFNQAEREWYRARYYDRRREYAAAGFHYEVLTTEFAETPFAEEAEVRLAQIAPLPPIPPQRMEWLVNLFPDTEDVRPLMASSEPTTTSR